MPKTMKSFRTKTSKEAEEILTNGMATVTKIEKAIAEHFPFGAGELSKAEASFRSDLETNGLDAANALLSTSIPAARDLISLGVYHIQVMERFISLNVPQMEDGNNFGVTVQMTVAKFLQETRESWAKKLDAIPAYYSSRADAVEKLGLAKTSSSQSKTESKSDSSGGKDGDASVTETKVVKEEKVSNGSKMGVYRSGHLLALDVQLYGELQSALLMLLDGYATVIDNMEKNKEKITSPKGTGPSASMGMY